MLSNDMFVDGYAAIQEVIDAYRAEATKSVPVEGLGRTTFVRVMFPSSGGTTSSYIVKFPSWKQAKAYIKRNNYVVESKSISKEDDSLEVLCHSTKGVPA